MNLALIMSAFIMLMSAAQWWWLKRCLRTQGCHRRHGVPRCPNNHEISIHSNEGGFVASALIFVMALVDLLVR